MERNIKLIETFWKGKHVVINEGQDDYTVGVIQSIDLYIDETVYDIGPKVKIVFDKDASDIDERIFLIETLSIKNDERFND